MTRTPQLWLIILAMAMTLTAACSRTGAERKLLANSRDGNLSIVQVLVDRHHVSPNVTNTDGQTPLMLSAERGHREIVQFLLVKGADAQIKDRQGRTALSLAEGAGRAEIAALLKAPTNKRS